jgi:hypothetical protein
LFVARRKTEKKKTWISQGWRNKAVTREPRPFPWGRCLAQLREGRGVSDLWRPCLGGKDTRAREQRGNRHMCTHTYVYTQCVHTHSHAYTYTYTLMCSYTYMCIDTYSHTHTGTHTPSQVLTEEMLLWGASWAPRTCQREPKCQHWLSNPNQASVAHACNLNYLGG